MSTVEEIRSSIREAETVRQKTAMFHLQVLLNAEDLDGVNAEKFCRELGLTRGYAREFTKMINLSALMKECGVHLVVQGSRT